MSEHFINEIEIKNYKLFKDFKAKGFGRVNLIGGKNNVGKTAFMEACYLANSQETWDFYFSLLSAITCRDAINRLIFYKNTDEYLNELIESSLNINIFTNLGKIDIKLGNSDNLYVISTLKSEKKYNYKELMDLFYRYKIQNYMFTNSFISYYIDNRILSYSIDKIKLKNKYEILNKYLQSFFNIEQVDNINNLPQIKYNGKYMPLYEYGQGVKSFLYIISSLLSVNNSYLFIDEIENGIHYTNFDKLWELILTISKEQNVQVFATTHSKECIESYAKISSKLLDNNEIGYEDIKFLTMYINKNSKVSMIVLEKDELDNRLSLDLDNR